MQRLFLFLVVAILSCSLPVTVLAVEGKPRPAAAAVATVNLNSATAKELEALPGIGSATAGNIVAYRSEKGKFKTVDELLKVKGIGTKTLEKIRNLVAVE